MQSLLVVVRGSGVRVGAARTRGRGAAAAAGSVALVRLGSLYLGVGSKASPMLYRALRITRVMSHGKSAKPFLGVWLTFPFI